MYGGGILPTIVFRELEGPESIDKIYEKYPEKKIREEALRRFREMYKADEIEVIPVKVEGLKRHYSSESERGGAMLEAFPEEDSYINGVILELPEDIAQDVDDMESDKGDLELQKFEKEKIETYLDSETMEEKDLEIPDGIRLFTPKNNSQVSNLETERQRNPVYHGRIMEGINIIRELYGDKVAEKFREDFLETTYERNPETGEWVKLSEQ